MGMMTDHDPRPRRGPGKTPGAQQQFKEECDINNIMKKYIRTGLVTHVAANAGRFADVSEVGSYQEAIQRVRDTGKFFLGLPVALRAEFENDPAVFLDFISDPRNAAEIEVMGLSEVLEPDVAPVPPVDPVVVAPEGGDPTPPDPSEGS